jgi:hypothetical protein
MVRTNGSLAMLVEEDAQGTIEGLFTAVQSSIYNDRLIVPEQSQFEGIAFAVLRARREYALIEFDHNLPPNDRFGNANTTRELGIYSYQAGKFMRYVFSK